MSQHLYKFLTIKSEMPTVDFVDTSSGTFYEVKKLKISPALVTSNTESDDVTMALFKLNKKLFSDFPIADIQTAEKKEMLSKG